MWREDMVKNINTKAVIKSWSKISRTKNRMVEKAIRAQKRMVLCTVMDATVKFDIQTYTETREESTKSRIECLFSAVIPASISISLFLCSVCVYVIRPFEFYLMIVRRQFHICSVWNAITFSFPHGSNEIDVFAMILTLKMCIEQINNNTFSLEICAPPKWLKRNGSEQRNEKLCTQSQQYERCTEEGYHIVKWCFHNA